MLASQRLAFRIARREAMRYKGRSALSITLLGLPLLGVAIGATAYDTTTLSPEQTTEQYLGENEAYIEFLEPGTPITQTSWDSGWFSYEYEGGGEFGEEEPVGRAVTDTEVLATLPLGSWITPYTPSTDAGEEIKVETPDGLGKIYSLGYNLTEDAYEDSGLEYLEGSAPIRDEVVLSQAAADYLELGVGDDLVVDKSVGTEEFEVSGIVEFPWDLNGRFAIGPMFTAPASGWLVDSPEPLTDDQVLALNDLGMGVWSKPHVTDPPPVPEAYSYEAVLLDDYMITIYALIVVVVVMEVVLLAGPAFAISARRRTREFALMSASGATPAQIRSTVLAGGVLFGLIAAVVAVLLGIGIVAAGLPLLERMVGYRSEGLRIMPWLQALLVGVAVCTGLLSALAAAISASRINVVAALMGRTPNRKGSKRWMVIGLAMVGVGIGSGFAGISLASVTLMAAAIVLAQLGLVACTPTLLALTARIGRWLPLAPRMALREAGRNRGSAAPAIAAVLGVVAGGMAFSMVLTAGAVREEQSQEHTVPQGTLTLSLYDQGDGTTAPDWDAALAEVEPQLHQRLDDLDVVETPQYTSWGECPDAEKYAQEPDESADCQTMMVRPEANRCPYWEADLEDEEEKRAAVEAAREDERCNERDLEVGSALDNVVVSVDPKIVALYTQFEGAELDEAVEFLESGGVLVADPLALTDEGTVSFEQIVTVWTEDGDYTDLPLTPIDLPAKAVDEDLFSSNQVFLGPGAAETLGLTESAWEREFLLQTSTEVDGATLEALTADVETDVLDGAVWVSVDSTDYTDPTTSYTVLAVTGLCALIALGATAVSTGLIIAEQRRDMTTLGAVGAAPGLRKRFAMWQTVVIALFGAGLGTVAGFIGYALIREALNRPLQLTYPFETLYGWELPWPAIGITVLAVPLIAAIGALLFTRAKLPSERRLT
jgi:putative ABC transport system permease protein